MLASPVPYPGAPRPWGSSRTPLPPHNAGTQEVRGGAGMRRNLLGSSSPPRPPPSFPGPYRAPRWGPTPCCPGRLGPDLRVARGRGCWRRQCLGNILWTAGRLDRPDGRVSPSRGRAEVSWGQSKHGPGWPDLGGWQGVYTYIVTLREPVQTHKPLSLWPQRDCLLGTLTGSNTHLGKTTQQWLSHRHSQ